MNKKLTENISLSVTAPYLYKAVFDGFEQLHGLTVVSLLILQQSLTHGQPHTLSYLELMVLCRVSGGGNVLKWTFHRMGICAQISQ